jgi:hypothetical protein
MDVKWKGADQATEYSAVIKCLFGHPPAMQAVQAQEVKVQTGAQFGTLR